MTTFCRHNCTQMVTVFSIRLHQNALVAFQASAGMFPQQAFSCVKPSQFVYIVTCVCLRRHLLIQHKLSVCWVTCIVWQLLLA